MKHIKNSPIDSAALEFFLRCKDYTVTGEEFTILRDRSNELLVTSPRPDDRDLAAYYQSEDYISHTDAKTSLFDKVYQWVRSYTLKKKIHLINSFGSKGKHILDVGAGTGDFLKKCQEDGWNINGVEPNLKAKSIAERKLNTQLRSGLSEIEGIKFDVITMWHVLEHVSDLSKAIQTLNRLLKKTGVLIIAVPNHKSYDANYYGKFWAAYDAPRHLWHFSQKAIQKLFAKQNMDVVKTLPMKFDAFYVSLLSEKYKTGNMNPFKAFFIGWRSNIKAKRTNEYSSLIYIIKNS